MVALLAAGLLAPVAAGVASTQVGDTPAQKVVSSRVLSEAPEAPEQPVVEPVNLVPERRVVEATTVEKAPPEPTPEQLRERAERKARAAASGAPFEFRIGSFNVLGSQHSQPGGSKSRYPSASWRTPQAASLAAAHGVDVLGTQELQADQLRGMQSRTGMAAYPGFGWGEAETDNSVLWDPGVFELVSGDRFTIMFMGRPRPQPIVRLRHLATGRELYVVNAHPSAGGGRYAAERANGHRTIVSVVNNLKAQGLPVFVTGDMNDREAFYCRVVPPAGLTASNGGSYSGGCRPPPSPLPVDWVVGSGATWSGYWRDTSPVNRKVSDHFFISATAAVG